MDFYESVSDDYDIMTRFSTRLEKEGLVLEQLIKELEFRQVLDAGCGTGLHTIALSQLGVKAIGIDSSKKMINVARKNAKALDLNIKFKVVNFTDVDKYFRQDFDLILCLGNVIPHILNVDELSEVFQKFKSVLKSNGCLIFQILNYRKILRNRQRMVGVTQRDQKTFIRFYDFLERELTFNILRIEGVENRPQYVWNSTSLYPWQDKELEKILTDCDYKKISLYSNLSMVEYDCEESDNLVVFCRA